MPEAGEKFQKLVEIMARLRGPGGCPWDREQTFDTIKPYTLEETYEVLDAIDRRDWSELAEELGDFMLQAVFYAQMAAEENLFRIDDALDAINQKLVRRHPHVFGDGTAETAGDVKRIWGEVKAGGEEGQGQGGPDAARLGAARAARAGGGAADRLARRGRGVRLGEPGPGDREAARRAGGVRPGAPQRVAAGTGRRAGRHAVRAGEPGAVREGGSGAGAAQDQRQVPPAVRLHRAQARGAAAGNWKNRT